MARILRDGLVEQGWCETPQTSGSNKPANRRGDAFPSASKNLEFTADTVRGTQQDEVTWRSTLKDNSTSGKEAAAWATALLTHHSMLVEPKTVRAIVCYRLGLPLPGTKRG